ncbi:MAG: hypothetical protein VB778_07295 [Nitrospinaceae bacterium]
MSDTKGLDFPPQELTIFIWNQVIENQNTNIVGSSSKGRQNQFFPEIYR